MTKACENDYEATKTITPAQGELHATLSGYGPFTPISVGSSSVSRAPPPPAPAGVSREEIAAIIRTHVSGVMWLEGKTQVAPSTRGSEGAADAILARLYPAPQLAAVVAERDWLRTVVVKAKSFLLTHGAGMNDQQRTEVARLYFDIQAVLAAPSASGPTGDAGGEQRHD